MKKFIGYYIMHLIGYFCQAFLFVGSFLPGFEEAFMKEMERTWSEQIMLDREKYQTKGSLEEMLDFSLPWIPTHMRNRMVIQLWYKLQGAI